MQSLHTVNAEQPMANRVRRHECTGREGEARDSTGEAGTGDSRAVGRAGELGDEGSSLSRADKHLLRRHRSPSLCPRR